MVLMTTALNKVSPVTIGNALERERLFALFEGEWPVTSYWISGPGGAGKTTLVASYLKSKKIPSAWYQVDALDADPATFFYYLSQSLAYLSATSEPLPVFSPEYLPNPDTFALRYFQQAFQSLPPHSWVVVDNFQDAPANSPLDKILALAVCQVPSHVTLIIISRTNPPPAMTRFLANRTMTLLHWEQLAFTPKELQGFLIHSGKTKADDELVADLYRLTKGWIAGIILWMLYQGKTSETTDIATDQTRQGFFDYFAAEIVDRLPQDDCALFFSTALLPSMTVETVEVLTGKKLGNWLEQLHQKNCFLERRFSLEPVYQYHPLFRDFLLSRAVNFFNEKEFQAIKRKAAEILEAQGLFEEAVSLFAELNIMQGIEEIILKQAHHLIAQGRHAVLAGWLEILPEDRVAADPFLLYWKSLALLTINPLESGAWCARAYALFSKRGNLFGRVLSWSLAVNIPFVVRNSFADLDQWIAEGDHLVTVLPRSSTPDLEARFASGMLMALLQRNQSRDDFEYWQNRCEALLDQCHDPLVLVDLVKNLCWSYAWMGMLRKGFKLENRLRFLCDDNRFSPLIRIIFYHSLAASCITRGEQRESHQMVDKALTLAEETGVHVFDFLLLANWCCILLGTGKIEQMPVFLCRMRSALSPFGKLDQGQYHCLAAWYWLQAEQPLQARGEVETAMELIDYCGSFTPQALVRVIHAQVQLELGNTQAARAILESIRQESRLRRSAVIQWIVDLASADCAYAQNRAAEAEPYCRSAFAYAREEGIGMIYGLSNRRLGAVCAKALDANIEPQTVRELIRRWQLRPPASESVSEQWPWPIRLLTLGHFSIHCDGICLALSAKTPRKPLELLALLIAAGKNGLPREQLADHLWPAADGDMAAQSLATTLHRLRRLFKNNEVVSHAGDQLYLNRELVWIDSWHFRWLALQIETTTDQTQRLRLIERALSLHTGPFISGNDHLGIIIGYAQKLHRWWLQVLAAAMPYCVENILSPVAKDILISALVDGKTADALAALDMSGRNNEGELSGSVRASSIIASELARNNTIERTSANRKLRTVH